MKHIHGLSITLLTTTTKTANEPIIEHAPSRPQQNALVRFNGQVGTRNIYIPAGQSFKVVLDLGEDFKIYKATGIKITVVANDKHGEQRCGFWWLDVKAVREDEAEFVIEGFEGFGAAKGGKADFVMPEVDPDHAKATTSWVTADDYCANKGCIAVFIERGNLIEKDPVERRGVAAKRKRSKASQEPVAIQLEDFLPLASHNSNPYIFEFRNMKSLPTAKPGRKSSALIQDTEIFADSDIDIEYDTDDPGAALPSEDEAEATDSESSSSSSDPETDAGSYSVISDSEDDAYDYLYEGPKRKAAPARKPASNKRRKTNAEKNAEADAANGSFVDGGGETKHADADATNATLSGLRLDDDRDDEELPCNVKSEPVMKQEKKVKTAGKGATPASPPTAKKRKVDDCDSDSAYSSEEENDDEDTIAVQHVKKPRVTELLEGMRATLHGLAGGRKVVSARQTKAKGKGNK